MLDASEEIRMERSNNDESALVVADRFSNNNTLGCDNLTLELPNNEAPLEPIEKRNLHLQPIPQVEAPKISHLNLESCNDVQIGTRIITSNLTVLGEGRVTVQPLRENNSEVIKCENVKHSIVLSRWIVCVLLIFLAVLTYFVLRLGYVSKDDSNFGAISTTATVLPTSMKQSSSTTTSLPPIDHFLITRNEWGSVDVNCTTNLGVVKTIKLISGFDCGRMRCSSKIKRSQELALESGRQDVEFHYAINDNGATYEGRKNSCQSENAYRECDKSFLVVRVYRVDEEYDAWYDVHAGNIIKSLVRLVAYGQGAAFIYGRERDDVILHLARYWKDQYFTQKLNVIFRNITFYKTNYDKSCNKQTID